MCFNSRVRVGRDGRGRRGLWFSSSFNSRVRVGRDGIVGLSLMPREFQLTRPRGTRPPADYGGDERYTFQLTRPRGTRRFESVNPTMTQQFQLTRPRGTRLRQAFQIQRLLVSTHASAWDATR